MTPTMPLIPMAKPALDEREVEAVRRVILSGWVTQGPEVAAFEREFADYVGAPFACAVANCTTALHLALLSLGVGPGDEVVTVSHSFIATANAVRYCGATPVFVDVQAGTYNIDPAHLEAAVTAKTKAILCVHQLGMPCDLTRIVAFGHSRGIPVIEDAACAIGSEIEWNGQWQRIGRPHADIACFSFHPRKIVTTGDGGMLTTANRAYDETFRLLRQHGMTVSDTVRHGARDVIFESYSEVGFNYRMTDLQAAVGRVQLTRLPEVREERRRLARRYFEELSACPDVTLPREPAWARSNWQSFCVELAEGADQKAIMQTLLHDGISTRRGVMNAHLEPAYAAPGSCRQPAAGLPVSEACQRRGIILPLYSGMPDAEVVMVTSRLRAALAARREPV